MLHSAISGVELTITLSILHFLQKLRLIIEVEYGDVILAQVFDEVFFRHTRDLGTIPYGNAILCIITQCYRPLGKGQCLLLRHPRIVKHRIRYLYRQFTHSFHLPLQPTFSTIVSGLRLQNTT